MNAPIHNALPLDIVVQILCKLNHDELKPMLTISKSFYTAVLLARQLHFNFSTPAPKISSYCVSRRMDESPGTPLLKLECKKTRKVKLPEEEIQRIAVILFPVGDCTRGQVSGLRWRSERISSHCNSTTVHVSTST